MFYETKNHHGLPHDPFKSCLVPRLIGWISTLSSDGVVNLAPYSFFQGIATDPPMVMFVSMGDQPTGPKDTVTNIEATGEFVCNMATWDLRDQMNISCAAVPADVDEMEIAGLEKEPSVLVKPPRVKASPIHMECTHYQTIQLPSNNPKYKQTMVLGYVKGVHIKDEVLTDGIVDITKVRPIARMGYMDYAVVNDVFTMFRPSAEDVMAVEEAE
jgi:flavin reductase (DIM6/NTAB) family NADH-FMN oxidoreductase RutF